MKIVIFIGGCSNRQKILKYEIQSSSSCRGNHVFKKMCLVKKCFSLVGSVRILVRLRPLVNAKRSKIFQSISLNIRFCFVYLTFLFNYFIQFQLFLLIIQDIQYSIF